jgi:hypothetical protein
MCTDCANGHYSTTGLTACLECPTGKYARLAHTECFHCPSGKYGDSTKLSDCTECAAGHHSTGTANAGCTVCPVGTFQALVGKDHCTDCPAGKYNPSTTQTTCPLCATGSYIAAVRQIACTNCPTGKYQLVSGQAVCTDCSTCAGGTYRTGCADSSAGTCDNCVAGQYKTGTHDWDTMCTDCANGHYSTTGLTACLECPTGKYARSAHTLCFICPRGKYGDSTKLSGCAECAAGSQSPEESTNCAGCEAGRFQHLTGKHYCFGCPEGKYNNQIAQTFCPECSSCTYSGNVATSCYSLARNCRVSQWSVWGSCDKTCAEGLAHRTRSVIVPQHCGGTSCPALSASDTCMQKPCPCTHVKCAFQTHTCTDYEQHPGSNGTPVGWMGLSHSNKGSDFNDGFGNKISGHHSNGGLCSTGTAAGCIGDDTAKLVLKGGIWQAEFPVGAKGKAYAQRQASYYSTCSGTHQSIRVEHHKEERKFTSGGVQHIEGHHCKMVANTCRCRCHRMFRHDYFPVVGSNLAHPCTSGTHDSQHSQAGTIDFCVDTTTTSTPTPADFPYNPRSCDNTNPDVSQPLSIPGKRHMAGLEAWSCKKDDSKFNLNYHPKDHVATPTLSPTSAPTENPCHTGLHSCDTTNGFCIVESHAAFKCGCNTNYQLLSDDVTCVYDVTVGRL